MAGGGVLRRSRWGYPLPRRALRERLRADNRISEIRDTRTEGRFGGPRPRRTRGARCALCHSRQQRLPRDAVPVRCGGTKRTEVRAAPHPQCKCGHNADTALFEKVVVRLSY